MYAPFNGIYHDSCPTPVNISLCDTSQNIALNYLSSACMAGLTVVLFIAKPTPHSKKKYLTTKGKSGASNSLFPFFN